jgi:DNA-binding transcriptional MerR regulator
MQTTFSTKLVLRLTQATENQLKYWVADGLVCPEKRKGNYYFSFRDVIMLRTIVSLKSQGLSLQKIRKGLDNLTNALPDSDEPLSRLVIYTNGLDMIVCEKGVHFSAITRQRYLTIDTEKIQSKVLELNPATSLDIRVTDRMFEVG